MPLRVLGKLCASIDKKSDARRCAGMHNVLYRSDSLVFFDFFFQFIKIIQYEKELWLCKSKRFHIP